MCPPGSRKLAVRGPHGRSIGPFSRVTPRASKDSHMASTSSTPRVRTNRLPASGDAADRGLHQLGCVVDLQQVDQGLAEPEDGRVRVLEHDRQAEDLLVEGPARRQVLDEQGEGGDATRPCGHGFSSGRWLRPDPSDLRGSAGAATVFGLTGEWVGAPKPWRRRSHPKGCGPLRNGGLTVSWSGPGGHLIFSRPVASMQWRGPRACVSRAFPQRWENPRGPRSLVQTAFDHSVARPTFSRG